MSSSFFMHVSRSFPSEEGKDEEEHHSSDSTNKQATPEARIRRCTDQAKEPATQGTANDTHDDAQQKAHAFTHDATGDEACQRTDNDRYDNTPHNV